MVTNDLPNGINFNCALIKKGLATPQEDEAYLQQPYELTEFYETTSSVLEDSFQVNINIENENDEALEDHVHDKKVVNKDSERPADSVCIYSFFFKNRRHP